MIVYKHVFPCAVSLILILAFTVQVLRRGEVVAVRIDTQVVGFIHNLRYTPVS